MPIVQLPDATDPDIIALADRIAQACRERRVVGLAVVVEYPTEYETPSVGRQMGLLAGACRLMNRLNYLIDTSEQ